MEGSGGPIRLKHRDLALQACLDLKLELGSVCCSLSTDTISPHAQGHYRRQLPAGSSAVRQVLCGRAWPQGTITSLCSPH